jgi:hypothetical protein
MDRPPKAPAILNLMPQWIVGDPLL